MRLDNYLFALLLLLGFSTCVEPISFDRGGLTEEIAVFGVLSTNNTHKIAINYTKPTGGRGAFIDDATINLYSDAGEMWSYFPTFEEEYVLFGVTGEVGKSYQLEIFVDSKRYLSEWQKMPAPVRNGDMFHTIRGTTVGVYANVPMPPNETIWLRFPYEEDYSFVEAFCYPLDPVNICYLNKPPSIQEMSIFTNENSTLDTLQNLLVAVDRMAGTRNYEYRGVHYYSTYVHSTTKVAHDYWKQINRVANLDGSIFDPVPAEVKGNLVNAVDENDQLLGFFEVAAIDTIRTKILPGDIPQGFFVQDFCPPFTGPIPFDYPRECCNCLRFDNATLQKPDWF